MVLEENANLAIRAKANQITESLSDMNNHHQPPNVFDRMWTPVTKENPIWKMYKDLLDELKYWCKEKKQMLSACKNCMTIFTPFFPSDYNLHVPSNEFKTSVDRRRIKSCLDTWWDAPKDEAFYETFQYKALIGLSKEAKAYKKEDDIEYIKLLRVVKGHRAHDGQKSFEHFEMCENCEVENDLEEVARKKFKTEGLAFGILKIIYR